MILLLISFFAGILTILAPCVLPVLPVIIGGSLGGEQDDKRRPYLIAGSLIVSVAVFTLLLKVSTALIGLSPTVLTDLSGGLIIALGLVSLFPATWENFLGKSGWQAGAQRLLGRSEHVDGSLIGPILTGAALGPVFSTCSPTYAFILASVLPHKLASGLFYLAAYCLGLGLALLIISLLGKRFIRRSSWLIDTHGAFRRLFGALFVLIGIAIINGWLVSAETWLANHTPFDSTRIEQSLLNTQVKNDKIKATNAESNGSDSDLFNVPNNIPAPEFVGLTDWINSQPQTMAQLKGKVVLVDFWTYSCINCLRTLPYVEQWYQTYADKGFVVIGVHTPEFAFEHVATNVQKFVSGHGLTYPVALDNDYGTWNAFGNNSWPAHYLIDRAGNVRDVHLGEGDYDKTERAIQVLLGGNEPLKTPTANVPFNQQQTPETYFGTERTANFTGSPTLKDGANTYKLAPKLGKNQWTLGGNWHVSGDRITATSDEAKLTFHTQAKDDYLVAGSEDGADHVAGINLANNSSSFGEDVINGQITINGSRLYHIVALKEYGDETVTLTVPKGVSLYTFTFGG